MHDCAADSASEEEWTSLEECKHEDAEAAWILNSGKDCIEPESVGDDAATTAH